jgi:hypothetical protein
VIAVIQCRAWERMRMEFSPWYYWLWRSIAVFFKRLKRKSPSTTIIETIGYFGVIAVIFTIASVF